jgi:hypothetical protein
MSAKDPTWLIDVSEHQGHNVNFRQVREEGYEGVIAKMSECTDYIDPTGADNLKRIVSSRLVPGAYHFLWGGMSARRQAGNLLCPTHSSCVDLGALQRYACVYELWHSRHLDRCPGRPDSPIPLNNRLRALRPRDERQLVPVGPATRRIPGCLCTGGRQGAR